MIISNELHQNELQKLNTFSNLLVICERVEGHLKNPDIVNPLKDLFHILFGTKSILDDQALMKVYRAQFSIDYNLLEAYEGNYITDESEKILAKREVTKYESFLKLEKEYWKAEEECFQNCLHASDLEVQRSFLTNNM